MVGYAILGCIQIVLGVGLILLRKRVHKIIHAGMRKFYGEGVAEMSSNPVTMPRYAILIGLVWIGFGVFNLVRIFFTG